jgi:tetratricopeptide (TPR) repeat protein
LEIHGLQNPGLNDAQKLSEFPTIQMFLSHVRQIKPEYVIREDEKPAMIKLFRLTEGLPLAIELAASWTRILSCEEIVAEIENNIGFLTSTRRDIPDRHRSLYAAFEHSWKLLNQEDKVAFRALSVFRGGFSREAASKVANASLSQLSSLMDKSLICALPDSRYGMHELLRQYAFEKLSESGEASVVADRHIQWFISLAETTQPAVWGTGEAERILMLETEMDNFRQALEWSYKQGDPEACAYLARSLAWYWYVRADYAEGRHWLALAIEQCSNDRRLLHVELLSAASLVAGQQGDYAIAEEYGNKALSLLDELEAPFQLGWALIALGQVEIMVGGYSEASCLFDQARIIFEEHNIEAGSANAYLYKGITAYYQADFDQAEELLKEGASLLEPAGDSLALSRALFFLGLIALHKADIKEAKARFKYSLSHSMGTRSKLEIAQCLTGLSLIAYKESNFEKAGVLYGVVIQIHEMVKGILSRSPYSEYLQLEHSNMDPLSNMEFSNSIEQGQKIGIDMAIRLALANE